QASIKQPNVELIHDNIGMDGTGRVGIVGDDVSTEEFKRAFLPSLPEGWSVEVSKPRSPLMEAYTPGRQNFNVDFFDEQGRKVTPPKDIFEPQKALGGPEISGEPPSPLREPREIAKSPEEGMTTLYRVQGPRVPDKSLPDWVKQDPKYKATVEATGRWFTDDPSK